MQNSLLNNITLLFICFQDLSSNNEFIEKAACVFDNKKDEALKNELLFEKTEKERLYSKVGQLTLQVDWLKKKSEEVFGPGWEDSFAQGGKR